jgi:uncharacterized protein (DUF58 family)
VDAFLAVVAAIDAAWSFQNTVTIEVTFGDVMSLGRASPIRAVLRSWTRRKLDVFVDQDLFEGAAAPELPVHVVLPNRGTAAIAWMVTPSKRGAHELGRVHVRYPSPLGFFFRQKAFGATAPVRVYPDLASLRTYDMLARQAREHGLFRTMRRKGGESEFERLREYLPDDEYRTIDWRATARSRKLIVRQYQIESNQSIFFVLDGGRAMTASAHGIPLFDHALNASLMLAHVAVRRGDRVGMLNFDDHVRAFVAPESGFAAQRRLIRASYALHARVVASDYDAAFRTMAVRVRKRSLAVLFTQIIDDVAANAVLSRTRQLLPTHLPLVVLLRDTEVEALAADEGRTDLALFTKAAAAEELRRRETFTRALTRAGVHFLSVRAAELTPALVNRYLEIKARNLL